MLKEIIDLIEETEAKFPRMTEDERYFLEIFIDKLVKILENSIV
jgi:hypothetical protein